MPFRLQILVPYELVTRGPRWPAIEAALADWITDIAPRLPDSVREFDLAVTPLRFARS